MTRMYWVRPQASSQHSCFEKDVKNGKNVQKWPSLGYGCNVASSAPLNKDAVMMDAAVKINELYFFDIDRNFE